MALGLLIAITTSCALQEELDEVSSTSEAIITCDADFDGFDVEGGMCGGDDCNDTSYFDNPEASEICADGRDNDCDGSVDEDDCVRGPGTCYRCIGY